MSFWYHAQCTCSSYVFLLCGQWHLSMKNTIEKFHKKYIKYQTEPRPRQKLWGRAEAETVRSRPRQDCEAEARPSQLKKVPRGRLEPRQMPRGLHPWFLLKIPVPYPRRYRKSGSAPKNLITQPTIKTFHHYSSTTFSSYRTYRQTHKGKNVTSWAALQVTKIKSKLHVVKTGKLLRIRDGQRTESEPNEPT